MDFSLLFTLPELPTADTVELVKAWIPLAMAGASALMGGKSGKKSAEAANQPTNINQQNWGKDTLDPYGGDVGKGYINDALSEAKGAYGAGTPNQQGAWDNLQGLGGVPGQGEAIQGGEINPYQPGGGYEIPGFDVAGAYNLDPDILGRILGGGGGGGGGGGASKWGLGDLGELEGRITGTGVDQSQYMQDVLGGGYLGGNEYTDQVIGDMQADASQGFNEIAAPQLAAQAQAAGAQGGTMAALANAMGQERANKDVNQQTGQMRQQMYESERDRQQQMQQILSGENTALRGDLTSGFNALEGSKASRYGADKSAGASRYGSRMGALSNVLQQQQRAHEFSQGQELGNYQFETGLGESISRESGDDMQRAYEYQQAQEANRLAGDRGYQTDRYGQELGAQGQEFGQGMDMYGAGKDMDATSQERIGQYISQIMPMLSGFGTQRSESNMNQTNIPKQSSPTGGKMTGALGGAMSGLGMGNMMGGKGGGGGDPGIAGPNREGW